MTRIIPAALLLSSFFCLLGSPSDGRPRADTEIRNLELREPNRSLQTKTGSDGVFGAAQAETTWFGGTFWAADSGRWEALIDSVWTFDSGVGSSFDPTLPNVNPYKTPGLHTAMEGWIGLDNTFGRDTGEFRRLGVMDFTEGTPCVGDPAFGAGVGGNYSFWAGLLPAEADTRCYTAGQGYGHNWNVCIARAFSYDGSGGVLLEYDFLNDTELNWDFTSVLIDTSGDGDGSAEVEVIAYTGTTGGHETLSLIPGETLPSSPSDIRISFCVTSDRAWSDEDGLYPTACGAFSLDNVSVSGSGIDHSTNFETGEDGWSQLPPTPGPGGDWSNIVHLSDLPPPLVPCECDLSDSVLVFEDLLAGGHNAFQDNLAISPWIDLGRHGLVGVPQVFVKMDYYAELPVLNYAFFKVEIQYYPEVCQVTGKLVNSAWQDAGQFFFFGGQPVCTRNGDTFDRSGFVPTGAEEIRVGLGVQSLCRFFANCTGASNSSPWVDNVQLGIAGTLNTPFLSLSGWTSVPQDNFPENGTLRINAPGRIDGPAPESGKIGIGSYLNDNLFVRGAQGGAEVRVQFSVRPGPGIDPVRFTGWGTSHDFEEVRDGYMWYSARMDSAAREDGSVLPRWFVTRYHEEDPNFSGSDLDLDPTDIGPPGSLPRRANDIFPDDLFTPGSRINLFYKVRFLESSSWFIAPDTTGGNYLEVEILPSSMDTDSTFNCVLHVDNTGVTGGGAVDAALSNILGGGSNNFENTGWDRYDMNAPNSVLTTFGRPLETEYGATITQALGYKSIIWNTGSSGNLKKVDAEVLIPWLTLLDFPDNSLYLTGDNLASTMNLGGAPRSLLEDIAGVLWSCETFREANCPPGQLVADSTACINLDPVSGADVAGLSRLQPHLAQGNGCPDIRSFDVLVPNPSPSFGVAVPDEEYAGDDKVGQYASISNDAAASGPLSYRTVVDGFSVQHRRESGTCDPDLGTTGTIGDRLREVLTWFGHVEGTICADPTAGTGVTFRDPQPTFKTALANFAPNPLMPGMTGQIRFTMAREAEAHLDIFDVTGRRVKTVFHGIVKQGEHELSWDGTDESGRPVAGGVYFYRLKTGGTELANKLVVVRGGS